ncbi:MAG: nucleotidyltransferase family protein [Chloroflexi bacterium]|nr:nucleotidyltransferase family protein [Chloroflexota bacterium]
MQVVILAGGLGTRLRPVVENLPKSMAPVAGRPFLEHQLLHLKENGFSHAVMLVGFKAEAIVEYFGDGARLGMELSYSVEHEPLGTAGALSNAKHALDERFLLLNGDSFFDVNYNKLVEIHAEKRAVLALALTEAPDASRFGSVRMAEDGWVVGFNEKSQGASGLINGGVYVVEKKIFSGLRPGKKYSLEHEVIPDLIRDGRPVCAMFSQGFFIDIGTPESYQAANRYFAGGLDVHTE